LIDSFIETKVGITQDFLDRDLAAKLKQNLCALYAERLMKAAGVGNELFFVENKAIRSDKIYWLDREHNDPHENSFFDIVDAFVVFLNETCYTGITSYEFHYAWYDKGSFYKKHLDQFHQNKDRAFSVIMYLNEAWQAEDGGELRIFHPDYEQLVAPINGRCVFFKSSELPHEVLLTNQPRLSITGWLKTGG
jgi:SM-20-related protein